MVVDIKLVEEDLFSQIRENFQSRHRLADKSPEHRAAYNDMEQALYAIKNEFAGDSLKQMVNQILYQKSEEFEYREKALKDKWLEIATKNAAISNHPEQVANNVIFNMGLVFKRPNDWDELYRISIWIRDQGYFKIAGVDKLYADKSGATVTESYLRWKYIKYMYSQFCDYITKKGYTRKENSDRRIWISPAPESKEIDEYFLYREFDKHFIL